MEKSLLINNILKLEGFLKSIGGDLVKCEAKQGMEECIILYVELNDLDKTYAFLDELEFKYDDDENWSRELRQGPNNVITIYL